MSVSLLRTIGRNGGCKPPIPNPSPSEGGRELGLGLGAQLGGEVAVLGDHSGGHHVGKDGDDIEWHQRHEAILQGLDPMLRLKVIGDQTDIERTAAQTDQV